MENGIKKVFAIVKILLVDDKLPKVSVARHNKLTSAYKIVFIFNFDPFFENVLVKCAVLAFFAITFVVLEHHTHPFALFVV
ncbi:hypothetical protein C3Y92_20605 (plasmid) [Solidesulfovibrio carbinolicus]|uniref:Uncharacterized protein n=1 Tax=Solidesulfovibrio carbinolicus TaxID=296842 RepID=A0A4P6HU11_9BACT|nr:hypothetical protein C3Y92_20605 [Solidesulfovibrio carbinolicus]